MRSKNRQDNKRSFTRDSNYDIDKADEIYRRDYSKRYKSNTVLKPSEELYRRSLDSKNNSNNSRRSTLENIGEDLLISHRKKRMRDRLISFLIFLLLLAILIFAVWYFFFKDNILKNISNTKTNQSKQGIEAFEDETGNSDFTESSNAEISTASSSYEAVEIPINPIWENRE